MPQTGRYAARLARLRQMMAEQGLDGLLCFGNGFRKDYLRYVNPAPTPSPYGFCLLTPQDVTLFVEAPWDQLPPGETVQEVIGARSPAEVARAVARRARQLGVGPRLGLAGGEVMEAAFYDILRESLGAITLVPASKAVMELRYVKDEAELEAIRRAAAIADEGWKLFVAACRPGVPQYEITARCEGLVRELGAEDNFMLMASGTTDVYGMTPPSSRRLERGDNVLTEFTPQVDGYYAQLCRTLTVGPPSPEQRRAFELFKRAADAALALIRPGVTAADIARVQNDVFRAEGYGEYCTAQYTRVRGHGLGLHFDEEPMILEEVDFPIRAGMVLIAHPNTYLPLAGYMVFGDALLVTETGCERLTKTERILFQAGES
ncbi:MAG TPA: Xaa-Pro peptidase family protein [Chloroflexota bacterium]|nr:Xaa-Pro peptidase family protein [Chloroflexota bacterium]